MVRHQHHDDRPALNTGDVVERGRILPLEFPDEHRLAHPALADQQDVFHPFSRRLRQSLLHIAEDAIRCGVLHPTLGTDVSNPGLGIESCDRPHVVRKMSELGRRHHQNSTPLVSPSAGMGTLASASCGCVPCPPRFGLGADAVRSA